MRVAAVTTAAGEVSARCKCSTSAAAAASPGSCDGEGDTTKALPPRTRRPVPSSLRPIKGRSVGQSVEPVCWLSTAASKERWQAHSFFFFWDRCTMPLMHMHKGFAYRSTRSCANRDTCTHEEPPLMQPRVRELHYGKTECCHDSANTQTSQT